MRTLTDAEFEAAAEGVREGSRAIERRDREALERLIAERWHEDCEWIPLIAAVEGERSYRGHAGLLAFYEDLWNSFEVSYGEPELRQAGNTVVYLTTMELRGRESGVEVMIELGVVWEPDGDRIRRGRAYDSHAAAIAAAEGLDA
jgi:hypothetical protein